MRALIYCRFSSDKQKETSVDDQARVCRDRADAEGFDIVGQHSDEGISGSTPVASRRGGTQLLADLAAERFDVLLVEGLDRLSRDQVEQERIVRRLEHRGIRILGVADGYDSQMGGRKIMRGVRGLINELYLDDLRHKTHRGQVGQFERGYAVGGKSYGYDVIKDEGGSRYRVNPVEAGHIRWIFERYVEGWGPQRIAFTLNERKVPSPRGGTWAVSAVFGSPNKGAGILNNELYVGRYVWNRSQWIKDPDTGRRHRVDRPESEWHRVDAPDLRIVPDELWDAVRLRMDGPRLLGGRGKGSQAKTLFGGLMECSLCGGAMIAVNKRLYGCANRKDRGPSVCAGIYVPREQLDTRLIALLRDELLSQASLAEIEALTRQAIVELSREENSAALATQSRMRELEEEIKRLVDAVATMGVSEALANRLRAAEQEKAKLAITRPAAAAVATSIRDAVARIKRRILDVQEALRAHDAAKARILLREIFGPLVVSECDGGIYAEFHASPQRMLISQVAGAESYLDAKSRPRNQNLVVMQTASKK